MITLHDGYRYLGRATHPGILTCLDYEEIVRDFAMGEEYANPKEKLNDAELKEWRELVKMDSVAIVALYRKAGGKLVAQINPGSMAYYVVKFGKDGKPAQPDNLFDEPVESLFDEPEPAPAFEDLF